MKFFLRYPRLWGTLSMTYFFLPQNFISSSPAFMRSDTSEFLSTHVFLVRSASSGFTLCDSGFFLLCINKSLLPSVFSYWNQLSDIPFFELKRTFMWFIALLAVNFFFMFLLLLFILIACVMYAYYYFITSSHNVERLTWHLLMLNSFNRRCFAL